jgi:murein L,D-transpeptidase YcbB/YkuD
MKMARWRKSVLRLKLCGLLVLGIAAMAWPGAASAPAPELAVVVDLAEKRLHVYEHGKLTQTYVVSVGMPQYRTPVGKYHIDHIVWNPWWIPPSSEWARGKKPTRPGPDNPMGRVKMYFAPEYYIHGTPEEATLGQPVSHGCVRMYEKDAIALARLVLRYGKSKVTAGEIDRLLADPSNTVTMPVPSPIPVEIRAE